ncbi:MAG: Gram-negative bacterial TonB protein C-terminal [Acidobacteria bacterium]|nr:Gram-negative bacterial TonB protein C-terminal [Acidobacteriota bacterium]
MSESSPCIRCGRAIDRYAKSCVYCNWDQTATPPPTSAQPAAAPIVDAGPVSDARRWKRRVIFGGALVALAILAFAIGAFVHREEKRPMPAAAEHGVTPAATTTVADNRGPHSDVTLIPVTDSAFLETPVTSAPAAAATDGTNAAQRNDATALPASEYAAVAERAKAEKQANRALVDPRSITGSAYDPSALPRRPAAPRRDVPMSSSSAARAVTRRTEPVPEYQPLPSIHVDRNMTARLRLTIGADGHVKGIAIGDSIPGQTPKLIAAVQTWRFRPATENGVPVEAPFSVDISFHGNE